MSQGNSTWLTFWKGRSWDKWFLFPLKKKMQLGSLSTDKNKGLIMHQTSRLVKVKPYSFHGITRTHRHPWAMGKWSLKLMAFYSTLYYVLLGRVFFHGRMPIASLCFCSVERRNLKKCAIGTGWTARAVSSNSVTQLGGPGGALRNWPLLPG